MTLRGSALNLMEALHRSGATDDPEIAGALARLEASMLGPDWEEMAASLDLNDGATGPAADNLVERWDSIDQDVPQMDAIEEVAQLVRSLTEARKLDRQRTQARIERVAQALAAAADHGACATPLERLRAVQVESGTVLCFPVAAGTSQRHLAALQRSLEVLRKRIKTTTGADVLTLLIPEESVPHVVRIGEGDNPPEGIEVTVKVDGRPIKVRQTPDGWTVPDALERGITLAQVSTACRLAKDGYGSLRVVEDET